RTNAEAYLAELQRLEEEVAEKIRSLPEPSRVLVTAHDAFGYFGDAYGMTVMGLQGISTASEAGTKDVRDLRDYLVRNKIKAVFIESSVPRKAIDAVIQGAKEQGHDLSIGGELFSDAMGEEGTPEGTYVGMIRHNVNTIVNALKERRLWDMNASPLTVRNLTVAYQKKPVLRDISFEVPEGKLIGIVGPNGAGKSTLIKAALGLIPKLSGEVAVYGQPYSTQRQKVGY